MFWAGYLFHWSDENRFVPELATVVPTAANGGISPDGRTIVYHLRPKVKWQDGAPFGADDIIFSYRTVMNPRNAVQSRSGYERIRRIDKVDDHRSSFISRIRRRHSSTHSSRVTMSAQTYPVLPKHLLARYPDINRISYNDLP